MTPVVAARAPEARSAARVATPLVNCGSRVRPVIARANGAKRFGNAAGRDSGRVASARCQRCSGLGRL
ncbi:MAG: hypothetical protein M3400_15555 [Actinomycetota bacterium]|nr:hypothetical protein [Actinomycetota bacterium]